MNMATVKNFHNICRKLISLFVCELLWYGNLILPISFNKIVWKFAQKNARVNDSSHHFVRFAPDWDTQWVLEFSLENKLEGAEFE